MNKPVIYYDFEKNALYNNKGEEYYRYGYYCTEENEVVDSFREIVDNVFILPEAKLNAIEKLLPIRDGNHCEHVMEHLKLPEVTIEQ